MRIVPYVLVFPPGWAGHAEAAGFVCQQNKGTRKDRGADGFNWMEIKNGIICEVKGPSMWAKSSSRQTFTLRNLTPAYITSYMRSLFIAKLRPTSIDHLAFFLLNKYVRTNAYQGEHWTDSLKDEMIRAIEKAMRLGNMTEDDLLRVTCSLPIETDDNLDAFIKSLNETDPHHRPWMDEGEARGSKKRRARDGQKTTAAKKLTTKAPTRSTKAPTRSTKAPTPPTKAPTRSTKAPDDASSDESDGADDHHDKGGGGSRDGGLLLTRHQALAMLALQTSRK